MPKKIMIVEDEVIVSADIRAKLEQLDYEVPPIVRYGEKVLDAVTEFKPDLVLMDIKLKGEMDGIQAARMIRERMNIPVIFLTAFSDEETLQRAKETSPYAYLKKPVKIDDLRIGIDFGLYRADMDRKLHESEQRFRTVADFNYDWETWVDPMGTYLYISPSCERTTGFSREEFFADPDFFIRIVSEKDREIVKNHMEKCHNGDTSVSRVEFRLVHRDGNERWLEHICRPVHSPEGEYLGRRASNRDITIRKKAEIEREKLIRELQDAIENIRTLRGLLPICSNCKKIRDDKGYWNQLEEYISKHSEAEFSHGICPDCMKKLYPEFDLSEKDV